jgi:DNA invertase Pin-like site-specific DNA recombinase
MGQPAGLRVLIAARLSKKLDGQTGIDSQDLAMRQWAAGNGHTVVDVVADKVTGRRPPWKRPNLGIWLTDPGHMVEYDAVAAFSTDRLTRGNREETAEIEKWARDNGKLILIADGPYFPAEGQDGLIWDIQMRLAHDEWLKISERSKRGIRWLTDNGYVTGALPFGYAGAEAGGHFTVAPDPALVPVIRKIYDRYMAGATGKDICEWLNGAGIASGTGGPWLPRTLTRYLHNPILSGRYMHNGRLTARVSPVLSDAEHEALIRRMAERVAPGAARRKDPDMLLGVLYCGTCNGIMRGRRITRVRADGSKRINSYYRCDGSALAPSGCRNMVRLDAIEATVNLWFETEDFSAREYTERTVIPGSTHQDELTANAEDMAALLAAQDDMAADVFVSKLAGLRAARDAIRALPAGDPQVIDSPTGLTIRQRWASLDRGARRAFLLDAGVTVHAARGQATALAYDDEVVPVHAARL